MANYFEKIAVIIDVTSDKAVAGIKSFKTSVSEAEGVTNKFKAGWSSLKSSGPGLATAMGAVGGAILGVSKTLLAAGDKFVETARQARELGVASGLTTEEASRLLEVFQDLGGDADALQGALRKIPATLESDKWDKYGIATKTAGGSIRSTNDILLDAIVALGEIEDPTKRAQAGIDLFGKSWGTLAPLIGKSRGQLDQLLGSVSKSKTITDDEVERAEDLAAAQDALKDAFEDVTLAVGQFVASASPLLNVVAGALGTVTSAFESLSYEYEDWYQRQQDVKGTIGEQTERINNLRRSAYLLTESINKSKPALVEFGDANKEAAQKEFEHEEKVKSLADVLAGRRDSLARRAYEAETRLRNLREEIEGARDWNTVKQDLLDYGATLKTLADDLANERITEEEYNLAREQATLDAKEGVLDYIDTLSKVDPEVASTIVAKIDAGAFAEVQAMLDSLKLREVAITPVGGISPQARGEQGIGVGGTYITVNVSGALDANGTATTIKRILDDHSRAVGNQVVWS